MKNQLFTSMLVLVLLLISNPGFSVVDLTTHSSKAAEYTLVDQTLRIDDIVQLDRKDIERKIGKKLKFKDRLALMVTKKQIKKKMKKGMSLEEVKDEFKGKDSGFHLAGFLLGLFLTLIGVLVGFPWDWTILSYFFHFIFHHHLYK